MVISLEIQQDIELTLEFMKTQIRFWHIYSKQKSNTEITSTRPSSNIKIFEKKSGAVFLAKVYFPFLRPENIHLRFDF